MQQHWQQLLLDGGDVLTVPGKVRIHINRKPCAAANSLSWLLKNIELQSLTFQSFSLLLTSSSSCWPHGVCNVCLSTCGDECVYLRLADGGGLGGQRVGQRDGVHDLPGLVAGLLLLPGVIHHVCNTNQKQPSEVETQQEVRGGAEEVQQPTWDPSLLHEVAHELWLGEQDVIQLVHAELVDLVDVLPAGQILVEGLHLACRGRKNMQVFGFAQEALNAMKGGLQINCIIIIYYYYYRWIFIYAFAYKYMNM